MAEPFVALDAIAAPLPEPNMDTGRIFPSRFLRKPRSVGLGRFLFYDLRYDADGRERADFVLNHPAYQSARILVAGANFGCGSSREAAVHAFLDAGFACIIAPSYGDIFLNNCFMHGLLPIVLTGDEVLALRKALHDDPGTRICVDLPQQRVELPNGQTYRFDIGEARKGRLMRGVDHCTLATGLRAEIELFEARYTKQLPWVR